MGAEPFRRWATLPQSFPFNIDPEPSPVVGLIAEALGLCCQVHGLVGWNATLVDTIAGCSKLRFRRLKLTNRFSERTDLTREKEFRFVSFCVPFSPIKNASHCF